MRTTNSDDFVITESDLKNEDYNYQQILTPKLDTYDSDFSQEIINEIVLWKVNRYVAINSETLLLINQINKTDKVLNVELTKKILTNMLNKKKQKGIRLAMASTMLRFKNPFIYQIIDQRVYRYITDGNPLSSSITDINKQIEIYLDYLNRLRAKSDELKIPFQEADRIFYSMDKNHNRKEKLK
ncbi:MAG: hypothetical protein ABI921_11670 [Panacibacter sp.]